MMQAENKSGNNRTEESEIITDLLKIDRDQINSRDFTLKKKINDLTIIIPAHNERECIGDTILSLRAQTVSAKEIIVVDDCSTDGTGDIAKDLGVTTIRPLNNTGSKAGAQNFELPNVHTEFTMAIDADTVLAPDAIEKLSEAFHDTHVVAACGFVIPRYVKTLWERGRYIEYLLAFTWYKPIQDYYEKPLISSGCFSMYRTDILKEMGGWSTRTLAEDMDLTWSFYNSGYGVRFCPEAICYPIEPKNFTFMNKQLRRWSHGYVQNIRLHWAEILEIPYLRSFIAVSLWDAVIASLAYLILLPLLAILLSNPILLLVYIIDIPVVLVPVLFKARERKEVRKALASIPSFFVLRTFNALFILEALFSEILLNKKFHTYEKGH
jgi:cellulose synthase/poly-beta-1,6-N-acetylglucosamine synthase-like glycosyltransferase